MIKKSIILMILVLVSFNVAYAKQPGYPSDWYCGDMHLHSKHSETESTSSTTVPLIMQTASIKNLDFIGLSDHSPTILDWTTCTTCYQVPYPCIINWKLRTCYYTACVPYPCLRPAPEWDAMKSECSPYTNPLCIVGAEEMDAYYIGISSLNMLPSTSIESLSANSRKNHYISTDACVDCGMSTSSYHGCGTNLACISEWFIRDTKNAGALGTIAHAGTWESWNIPNILDADAMEIWNGASNGQGSIDDNILGRMIGYFNNKNLPSQKVLTMTGNSDMCTRNIPGTNCGGVIAIGEPRTCCIMGSVSKSNIFNSIKSGKCQANNGPLIELKINNARVGDYLNLIEGSVNVSIQAYSRGFGELTQMPVKIYYNGNVAQTFSFAASECTLNSGTQICSKNLMQNIIYNNDAMQYIFARLDSNSAFSSPSGITSIKRAITNPIWLNVSAAPIIPTCNETDGGRNVNLAGKCISSLGYNTVDYCYSATQVMEYYCNAQKACANEVINCAIGYRCYNGVCIKSFTKPAVTAD